MDYPPLVTHTELAAAHPGASFSPDDLAAAVDDIRAECGWHIAPEVAETFTLRSDGQDALVLPTLKLTDVLAVRYWDGTSWADVAGWDPVLGWDPRSCCVFRPGGFPRGRVQVDVLHGYTKAPPSLVKGVARLASGRPAASEVAAENLPGHSVQFRDNTPAAATMASFASSGSLSRYRLGPRP